MYECSLSEENVKLLGRTYFYQEVLWLAYSASGAEFQFNGTECSIDFVGDNIATDMGEAIHHARVAIYVNDKLVADDCIDAAKKTIDVYKNDIAKDVTVRIVKLSESEDSTVGIKKVRVVGTTIKKTKDKALKIEFIGDSITCGYGVEEELGSTYSTKNENAMKAFAYQTAKVLDADYSMVSISGYGVVSGYTGTGVKNEKALLLPYYDKIGKSNGRIASETAPEAITWDFSKFIPDVIVINLGTNDISYCGTDISRCQEFEAGYIEFIKTLRDFNPNAMLVCTLGIMGDSLFPYLENAVKFYQKETNDNNIVTMKFDNQLEADGLAVDYHPSWVTHTKATAKLVNYIKNELELTIKGEEKLLALTFDDGPVDWSEDSTAMKILKTLNAYGQRATFFYVGEKMSPDNSKEILFAQELGCEIANHTWTHPDMTSLTETKRKEEIDKTSAALKRVTGKNPFLFRLPYLACNDEVLATVGAPCISCCVDSRDYMEETTKEDIINCLLDAHEKGTLANSVVLMHEPYQKTQEAVAEIVPKLIQEGYQLVTVSELAKRNGITLEAGKVYSKLEKIPCNSFIL